VAATREEDNEHHHITCPQPHKQLLAGWVMGGMTTTQATGMDNDNDTECYSTHPHAYNQLLMGWMTGAVCYGGGCE